MPLLLKATRLQRAADLDIRLLSNAETSIFVNGCCHPVSENALTILHIFSTPKTLQDGILEAEKFLKSPRAWIEFTNQIRQMFEVGILVDSDNQPPVLRSHHSLFSGTGVHIRMLNDQHRTLTYQQAIRQMIKPGDVVVEIGTGTGILSATAAAAGAKHVYAIERTTNMPRMASNFFAANNLADKITIVEGDSVHVELPEKADIFIAEIIGNDPLEENILRSTRDAVHRFLKPSGQLIPGRIRIYGLPVQIPEEELEKHIFKPGTMNAWKAYYGFDFTPFSTAAANQNHSFNINTYHTRQWPALTAPLLLADIDLMNCPAGNINSVQEATIQQSGTLNGIIIYFELDMGNGIDFSIHPDKATLENNWASKVWVPGTSTTLQQNETIQLCYCYSETNESQFELSKLK